MSLPTPLCPHHLPDGCVCPLLPLSGLPLYLKVNSNLPKALHSLVPGCTSNFISHFSSSLLCFSHTVFLKWLKHTKCFNDLNSTLQVWFPFVSLFKCLAPSYPLSFSLHLPSSERPLLIPAREDRLISAPSRHSSFSLFHLHLSEIFFVFPDNTSIM